MTRKEGRGVRRVVKEEKSKEAVCARDDVQTTRASRYERY